MTSTVKLETEIGLRNSPDFAWPTVLLLAGVLAGLALSTGAVLAGAWPMALGAVVNTVILYATYTIVHEAAHYNIVPRDKRFRWVNTAVGLLACVPLWMLFFPHRKSHLVHHRKCNTDEDPDIYARGPFGVVAFWRLPLASLGHLNPIEQIRQFDRFKVTPGERVASVATFAAYTALAAAVVYAGYGMELLVLWFVPFIVGNSVMLFFFTWVPHHPHSRTGRYADTRVSLWPGADLLTQGQHAHLIHHMMPWIPWYRYDRVFRETRPMLEQNGATIDGFWPGSRPA